MNSCYKTVWNATLGACVAAAENVSSKRGGKASGSRRTVTASAALALAALAAGGAAQAATFTAASEAELITAINDANASLDSSSTITVTKAFTVTTQLPQISSKVAVSVGSAGGATLDLRAGATYQTAAATQVGIAPNTTGIVVAQGSGTALSGTALTTGAGQSTVSVLDGASAVFTGNLNTGAGSATINVGKGASMSVGNLNSGIGHTAINVTGGGKITVGTNANLGGGNGAANGGITDVVVSGTGSAIQFGGASGYYHHAGTLEVSAGGFVGANTVQVGFRAGDVFTAIVTGPGSVFGSVNNNLTIGGTGGTATVTVADGALLTSGTSGTNTLSLANTATGVATLNIGAPVGSAPAAPGAVTAKNITSSSGQSTINFNHNASSYEFAVPIGGNAIVNQIGSGTTTLTGDNNYSGGTTITAGTLQLGNGGTTGSISSAVVNNATLAINRSNAVSFPDAISGSGVVQQRGTGTTTLSGTNTYTGGTVVQAGRLLAGSAGAFVQNTAYTVNGGTLDLGIWDLTTSNLSGTGGTVALNAQTLTANQAGDSTYAGAITGTGGVVKSGAGVLTLSGTNSYSGNTFVTQGTVRAGAVSTFSSKSATVVANGATLDLAGHNQTLASVNNSGTVSLAGAAPGTTLTVTGPWVGNGGTLRLGTALSDSSSASDKLVLSGATAIASGTANVQITNLGGLGALTTGNGIEVVSAINGATTTAQTTKNAFALAGGHVDAGAYEYRLYAADASGAGENWYLRSTVAAVPPTNGGGTGGGVVVPAYRTEVPLYAVLPEQFRQANLSMLGSLHMRMGDNVRPAANDAGPAVAGQSYRQAWGRLISTDRTTSQTGTVSPTSRGRLTGVQAGTDLWADTHWRAGVYVGQLDGDMRVNGFASGLLDLGVGINDLKNQYFGVYGTWKNDNGLYIDGVLQGGRHRYTASPVLGLGSGGKGSSLLASVEVGQSFGIAAGWTIEPQLQLVHQRVSLDDASIVGALIRQDSDSGWLVRAGVRVKGEIDTGAGPLQPYARLNLYHTGSGTDVARFIGPAGFADIATRTGGSSGELAAGASWQLSRSTSLYGELGKLWDMSGDARNSSGINASVGVKVLW
ncbi:autotransporter outer membrane beta-barrel domain-containing protein [Variovorax sp. V15]|uniref:autotransporter outer membrane beta-barrel domain-containing protein n=1 Tax=Variovorax sp. V15 TaxID=3065952 RepID=UPI0034E8F790